MEPVTSPGPAPFLLECLEAICRLEQERPPVAPGSLAKRLGIRAGEAAERILALERGGLVQSEPSGRIRLTAQGRRIALGLLRKHRLAERFLADLLKLPWERVHEEAGRLTPVLSDEVADGLAVLLHQPTHCPHGNPIPSAEGALAAESGTALHRLRPGQGGVIVRIEREEPEMLKYLAALGLLPESKVEVEEVAPFGGPVLVRLGSARYALGRKVASRIFVREA